MSSRLTEWIAAMRGERYEQAWALRHATLAERDHATRDDPRLPYHLRWVWDGRPIAGRAVLVRCYQGLGDTIQFLRFLPLLADRAGSVSLEIAPSLADLARRIDTRVHVHPFDPACPLPQGEVDIEITELDFALQAKPADAPPPYVTATPAHLPRGTIGLCHATGDWDPARALPPDALAPLCAIAPCVTLAAQPSPLPVLNPAGCPFSMAETAALVAGVDLVVTVDTMIAHLAGALGKPTWLLLKAEPDWRWAPDRAESAWYPHTRLYVQPSPGDWGAVIERVARDLAGHVSLYEGHLA